MTASRRHVLRGATAVLAAPFLARTAWSQDAPIVLRLQHALSPVANVHSHVLVPWAKRVEEASGKRVRIDLYPTMQLGGSARELYDQARYGVVDLVWTRIGQNVGVFPRTEIFELPFVASMSAVANCRVAQSLFDSDLRNDFPGVQVIGLCVSDGAVLHASRPVHNAADIRTLKLGVPSPLAGDAVRALAGTAVAVPLPQVRDGLARKAIEGCLIPWEAAAPIKLHEIVRHHVEIPGSTAISAEVFVLAMNKTRYDLLPPDVKKAIDENSGIAAVSIAGRMWDDRAALAQQLARQRGNTIAKLDDGDAARWRKASEPAIQNWIRQSKDRGFDGERLLADVKAAMTRHAAG
ncbi:MAG: TRAP transporter substrate-binding protein [Pseudorhodoplanes sp.]|nr:TRAP transporter substrate-binding protein [Pseudorhodoplanes sp.]